MLIEIVLKSRFESRFYTRFNPKEKTLVYFSCIDERDFEKHAGTWTDDLGSCEEEPIFPGSFRVTKILSDYLQLRSLVSFLFLLSILVFCSFSKTQLFQISISNKLFMRYLRRLKRIYKIHEKLFLSISYGT